MVRSNFVIMFILIAFSACGKLTKEDKDDRAIRTESDVFDARISELEPDSVFTSEEYAKIGFDQSKESRLLLYFPKITSLYASEVNISSITSVELRLNVDDIKINPKNIKLYALNKSWSPFVTWNSRFNLNDNELWDNAGGDFSESIMSASPDIRQNTSDGNLYELSFDITEIVFSMVNEKLPNYGFIIKVEQNSLNTANEIGFVTYNSSRSAGRPVASLVFNNQDSI